MIKGSFTSLLSSAALALALVSGASATTVTIGNAHYVNGEGYMSSQAGAVTTTFDGLTHLPSGFTATNNLSNPLATGRSAGNYLNPTGDNSTYATTGTGVVQDAFAKGTTYFGFYWGSLDNNNDFAITESNGSTFNMYGATLASDFNVPADGNSSYFVNFFADPGTTFAVADFRSSSNAFEFDNVATATPEPGTVAMLAGGLLILVGAFRRRKSPKTSR
jgi:hypothetical protein